MKTRRSTVITEKPVAVIFDTDNTLYPYEPAHKAAMQAAVSKATQTLGISEKLFNEAYNEARRSIKKQLGKTASSHSRLLYFQRTIELLGLHTQILITLDLEQTYWRTFLANCHIFPETKDFLIDLKSKGIITAIITDLTAQIQFRKLIYFGLDDFFDYVVTSEEAGKDKPDIKPFQIALQKLNVEPEKIWMIGDNPENDMSGADQLNMKKIQKYHKGVVVKKTGSAAPHVTFEHYNTLRKLLESLE